DAREQRRRVGAGRRRRLEADARFLVERLGERHLARLVAALERLAEAAQALVPARPGHAAERVHRARDLVDDRLAERRARRRLQQVDLEQPRQLDGRGQGLERAGDVAVALWLGAHAAGVERRQRVAGAGERGRRGGRGRRQRVDEAVDRLGAGQPRLELGDEDLAVDELAHVPGGVLGGDVAVDKGGGQL